MASKVVSTEDGSITWLDDETGELYHNRAGAFTEAWKNYIEPCCLARLLRKQNSISVFDVCFGLGYNSYLFIQEACRIVEEEKLSASYEINVRAVDRDPNIVEVLPLVLNDPRFAKLKDLRSSEGQEDLIASLASFGDFEFRLLPEENVELTFALVCDDLRSQLKTLVEEGAKFDFIFHDGFSPRKVPELWTKEIFQYYGKMLSSNGKLLTYSSSAAVRGALKEVGLEVRRTAAVGGKSGGTIAGLPIAFDENPFVFPLTDEEQKRLETRSAIPYRDPDFALTRSQIVAYREREMRDIT